MPQYEDEKTYIGREKIAPRWEHEPQEKILGPEVTLGLKRQEGIGDVIEMCHSHMHELMGRLEDLEKRLDPILSSPYPMQEMSKKPPGDEARYTGALRDLDALIRLANDRLSQINNRVQL